jgi:hypothetical protein
MGAPYTCERKKMMIIISLGFKCVTTYGPELQGEPLVEIEVRELRTFLVIYDMSMHFYVWVGKKVVGFKEPATPWAPFTFPQMNCQTTHSPTVIEKSQISSKPLLRSYPPIPHHPQLTVSPVCWHPFNFMQVTPITLPTSQLLLVNPF